MVLFLFFNTSEYRGGERGKEKTSTSRAAVQSKHWRLAGIRLSSHPNPREGWKNLHYGQTELSTQPAAQNSPSSKGVINV